jgi:fluoride exporter
MRILAGIAVAGALGALARYLLDGWISGRGGLFPWGTFVINISGSFLLGLVFTLFTTRLAVQPWIRSSLTVGLLGAYTTFSTLTLETVQLAQDGQYLLALCNAAGSLVCGLVAVFVGVVVGRAV